MACGEVSQLRCSGPGDWPERLGLESRGLDCVSVKENACVPKPVPGSRAGQRNWP